MDKRVVAWVLAACLLLQTALASTPGAEPVFQYPGIHTPLTEPEQGLLRRLPLAKAGDAGALLDLSIVAAGDRRGSATFASYHRLLEEFAERLRPSMEGAASDLERGRILFAAMRTLWMGDRPEQVGKGLTTYDMQQSRLTTLLEKGRHNCFSSSVLYIVLARYFDLRVAGVVLPSHTFVQLEVEEGRVVEIETTSPTGFAVSHDQDYYQREAASWSRSRGFSPATYQDYLARDILSPYDFIALNMIAQHTAAGAMAEADRQRLNELWGHLNPERRQAQLVRLSLYHRLFEAYRAKKNTAATVALYDQVARLVLQDVAKRWAKDPEVANAAAWSGLQYALALLEVGRHDEALEWTEFARLTAFGEEKILAAIIENADYIRFAHLRHLADEEKFKEAAEVAYDCKGSKRCPEGLAWVYQKWADQLTRQRRWEEAANRLIEMRKRLSDEDLQALSGLHPVKLKNLVGRLFAQAIRDCLRHSEWTRAKALFQQQVRWSQGLPVEQQAAGPGEKDWFNHLTNFWFHNTEETQ